jgi:hypothetical protein
MRMPPFSLVALATLSFFCGLVLLVVWPEATVLAWLIGFGVVIYCVVWTVRNRPDPYDMSELRRAQEQAELRAIEEAEVPEDAGILCTCCHEQFHPKYLVCPHCGKAP